VAVTKSHPIAQRDHPRNTDDVRPVIDPASPGTMYAALGSIFGSAANGVEPTPTDYVANF